MLRVAAPTCSQRSGPVDIPEQTFLLPQSHHHRLPLSGDSTDPRNVDHSTQRAVPVDRPAACDSEGVVDGMLERIASLSPRAKVRYGSEPARAVGGTAATAGRCRPRQGR